MELQEEDRQASLLIFLFTTNFSAPRAMKYSKEAVRTAFLKEYMATEVQAGSLSLDAVKSSFGNYREDRYIPSSRCSPCEAKKNGIKTVVNVLIITGEPDYNKNPSATSNARTVEGRVLFVSFFSLNRSNFGCY